jgi:hypothetical protein
MEKKMKATTAIANPIDDSTRCQRRRPSGRRCKLTVMAPGAPFCFTHTKEFNKADTLNLKTALLTGHQGFQTAQGINNSLRNLYILLANNYISPRRAAVLAFINSLQLRTLPAIDADQAAGIIDPTAPEDDEIDTEDGEAEAEDDETDMDDDETDTNEEIEIEIEPNSSTIDAEEASASASPTQTLTESPQDWSAPEPDPTKKPS